MRLAAIYNVWDGLDLLPYSLAFMRPNADMIIVVWQEFSNWGERCDRIKEEIARLERLGLIEKAIKFQPVASSMSSSYAMICETKKRQMGIDAAMKAGCTHFISMDADELYLPDEFAQAKKYLYSADMLAVNTCVPIQVYLKTSTLTLNSLDETLAPFICPLRHDTRTGIAAAKGLMLDRTRTVGKNYTRLDVPIMHHLSYVRTEAELLRKVSNSTARKNIFRNELIEEIRSLQPGHVMKEIYAGKTVVETVSPLQLWQGWRQWLK